jgi:superfamily I DNA/RNA helicase
VHHHSIPPEEICAVTFTNKAANEMKERLKKLIGPERTTFLVMGWDFPLLSSIAMINYSARYE